MSRDFSVPADHHRIISPVMNLCKMFDACSPCPTNNNADLSFSNRSDDCFEDVIPVSSWLHVRTPSTSGRSLWDSGIDSFHTPMASSTMVIGVPRRATMRNAEMRPIPFEYDCDEDSHSDKSPRGNVADAGDHSITPMTPSEKSLKQADKRCCPVATPLGRSLCSLNISQTPRRSMLQRRAAQKSVDKAHRIKLLTARERRAGIVPHRPQLQRPSCDLSGPQWNVNPFAYVSAACAISPKLESHSVASCELNSSGIGTGCESPSLMDVFDDSGIDRSVKKLCLRQINISRFEEEFHAVETLGEGQFGDVYKCINRLDGCLYAIKKSKLPVAGTAYERNALNEVYAHAVLGKHPHIVGYYSSWAENDRIFIQTEYCNGANLSTLITEYRYKKRSFTELELKQLTSHIASGLKYIHAHGLVHLDIKPDNILIQRLGLSSSRLQSMSSDGSFDEGLGDEGLEEMEATIYKISDLGQVTSSVGAVKSVEEGDCRYLPCELLADKFYDLPKADVFSLALTVYETGSDRNLPPNGLEWHQLRENGLPGLQGVSKEFNSLIKMMAAFDTKLRPSSQAVAQSEVLSPFTQKSAHQLRRELIEEKQKNEVLSRELAFALDSIRQIQNRTRIIGRGCGRSKSVAI